jgi:hypothetical protein
MPLDSLEFRTSLKKLLVGLILVLVLVTVFGFMLHCRVTITFAK